MRVVLSRALARRSSSPSSATLAISQAGSTRSGCSKRCCRCWRSRVFRSSPSASAAPRMRVRLPPHLTSPSTRCTPTRAARATRRSTSAPASRQTPTSAHTSSCCPCWPALARQAPCRRCAGMQHAPGACSAAVQAQACGAAAANEPARTCSLSARVHACARCCVSRCHAGHPRIRG